MDYIKELQINPDALDLEWLNQPVKFMRVAQLCAEANDDVRRLEEDEKVLRSKLTLAAMSNGEALGLGAKPTGAAVEAYFRQHPDHVALKNKWLKANYTADLLNNAVSAFKQRKDALENMARLHGQQYFAGPREPRDLSAAYRESMRESQAAAGQEETATRVRERLNPNEEEPTARPRRQRAEAV